MYKHKKNEKQTEVSNCEDLFYIENGAQMDTATLNLA